MRDFIEFLFGAKFSITIYNHDPKVSHAKVIGITKLSFPRLQFYISQCKKYNNDFRITISGKDKDKNYMDNVFFIEKNGDKITKSSSNSSLIIKYLNRVINSI